MKWKFFKISCMLFFVLTNLTVIYAQKTYQIDVSKVRTDVLRGHLNLGGKNNNGDTIGVNSFYIERNGKPFIPVVGEFHYSRYPHQYWDEQLKKMKAGGIDVVATYVFWILHETKEGVFNWTGDLDLRHFIELCAQNGLDVIVRVGPFDHGEIRNGGLPDWLYGRPIEVRSNDPVYLSYANKLYQEIGGQLKGLMYNDGGPIIGVQIENELQHSAAAWGFTYLDAPREFTVARRDKEITHIGAGVNANGNQFAHDGKKHMNTLKEMAIKAGLVAPIYTATGWGFATIVENGSIPVMSGYAFPYWSEFIEPSPFYLYKNNQQSPDLSPVSYDSNLYPSLAAELGTGMSNIYTRRPRVPAESYLPMMVRTMGCGTNGLGYYMYHGGTTPSVGNYFLNEGFGLAHKSYDYQAPIREFGQIGQGFYPLKIINNFLKSYGDVLAPMYPVFPETNNAIIATDTTTLRYAVRSNGKSGFVFMHNYQDHVQMPDLKGLKINVACQSETVSFPENGTFNLKSGVSAILPFHISFDGIQVRMATVQPFCKFVNQGKTYHVFASIDGIAPEMVFQGKQKLSGSGFKTSTRNGNTVATFAPDADAEIVFGQTSFLIIPFKSALDAYVSGKKYDEHLIISNATVLTDNENLQVISENNEEFDLKIYPEVKTVKATKGEVTRLKSTQKNISLWHISLPKVSANISLTKADDRHFVLKAPNLDLLDISDVFIKFDYRGDRGICMMNGLLVTDDLYASQPWYIGLKRFREQLKSSEMYFYFIPMRNDAPYLRYLDKNVIPDFGDKKEFLEIKEPEITVEYKVVVTLED